jgi:hypothetical protein
MADAAPALEKVVQPFSRYPFDGVQTPLELAERMRAHPILAVPLLECGAIADWFESNGLTYPVAGPRARGLAAIQQFFEGMKLSKPPPVRLLEENIQVASRAGETVVGEVTLHTPARKWIYASATSDVPWLRVTTPMVAGPRRATIAFEASAADFGPERVEQGRLRIVANSGQELSAGIRLDVFPARHGLVESLIRVISRLRSKAARIGRLFRRKRTTSTLSLSE